MKRVSRLKSVSESLFQDAQKLEIYTSSGGKTCNLERTKENLSGNARELLKGKLATSEGSPDAEAYADCRRNCSQFGAFKPMMAGNGDSCIEKPSKFKEGGCLIRNGSVAADIPFNTSHSQLQGTCKGSSRDSKSLATSNIDLTKSSISVSEGMDLKVKKPNVTHLLPTRRAFRFVDNDNNCKTCKTPIHNVTSGGISLLEQSGTLGTDRKPRTQVEPCPRNSSLSNTGKVCAENVCFRIDECANNITGHMNWMENFTKQKRFKTSTGAVKRKIEVLVAPGNSVESGSCKTLKRQAKMSNIYKAQLDSLGQTSGSAELPQNYSIAQKHKPFLEKSKVTAKSSIQATAASENTSYGNLVAECYPDKDVSTGQRSDITRESTSTDSADSKLTDSAISMKHLIAVAQAKMREAHSHQLLAGNGTPHGSLGTPQYIYGKSINLKSAMHIIPSVDRFQTDKKCCQTSVPSKRSLASWQSLLMKQGEHGDYDGSPRRENCQPASCSSEGAEATVARDALEGMIETLSRTKESIGRATRHSIDCAKYGLSTEIVEILVHRLEEEPNFSRRIDLFFLVDSITQCSHNLKGIAGASYVPVVQAALPRILRAAAPPGVSANENRRQCLKVLRLWLERKILPEYFLRHYIDVIELQNDGLTSGFSPRILACVERSVNDPIREMESLLVDEYGSNTTFLFPGFLSGYPLDDSKDFSSSPHSDMADCSPNKAGVLSEVFLVSDVHRMQAHPHLLEHLENEIEMEDALTLSSDESLGGSSSFNITHPHRENYWALESTCGNENEIVQPACTPPLPSVPPPTPPPLPLSPPPPPPPPPLSSLPPLPSSPLPAIPLPPLLRRSLLPEFSRMASDKQSFQTIDSNAIEGPNAIVLKNQTIMHQSPNFVMSAVCNTNTTLTPTSSKHLFDGQHGHFTHQDFCSEQLFQLSGETNRQLPFPSAIPGQKLINQPVLSPKFPFDHLCHPKSMSQHYLEKNYNSFALPSFPHGQRKVAEQRRSHHSDANQYFSGT